MQVYYFSIFIWAGANFVAAITQNPHTVRPKKFGIFLLSFRRKEYGKIKKNEILVFTPAWLLWKVAPKESNSELIIRDNFREAKGFKLIWKIRFQVSKANCVIEKKN